MEACLFKRFIFLFSIFYTVPLIVMVGELFLASLLFIIFYQQNGNILILLNKFFEKIHLNILD